eukprot:1868459-Pleurochrysis_carterae.AAC.2
MTGGRASALNDLNVCERASKARTQACESVRASEHVCAYARPSSQECVPSPPPANAERFSVDARVDEWQHSTIEERVGLDAVDDVELVSTPAHLHHTRAEARAV